MDQESYEQVELDEDLVGDSAKFLKENTVCEVQVFDEKPLGIELPRPSIWRSPKPHRNPRSATVTNRRKPSSRREHVSACLRLSSRALSFASIRKTGEYLGKA